MVFQVTHQSRPLKILPLSICVGVPRTAMKRTLSISAIQAVHLRTSWSTYLHCSSMHIVHSPQPISVIVVGGRMRQPWSTYLRKNIDSPWPILAIQGGHLMWHLNMYLHSKDIDSPQPIAAILGGHSIRPLNMYPGPLKLSRLPLQAAQAHVRSSHGH